MRRIPKVSSGYGQLRWVILLLAIAVILPTVCLLWFISQAVKNERLAVRQKLISAYQRQLEEVAQKSDDGWVNRLRLLDKETEKPREPIEVFRLATTRDRDSGRSYISDSVIIYDSSGNLLYPIGGSAEDATDELARTFKQVWDTEYVERDFAGAIGLYEEIAKSAQDAYVRYSALMGKVRCLRNSGDIANAIRLCREVALGKDPYSIDPGSARLRARARILLVNLEKEGEGGVKRSDLGNLISSAINYGPITDPGFLPMPSGTRIFSLRKGLELVKESPWANAFAAEASKAEDLLRAEELAAAVLDHLPASALFAPLSQDDVRRLMISLRQMLEVAEESELAERLEFDLSRAKELLSSAERTEGLGESQARGTVFDSWAEDTVRRLELPQGVFGIYRKASGRIYLLLQAAEEVRAGLDAHAREFLDLGIRYRIVDDTGRYVAGMKVAEERPFLEASVGEFLPGWGIELYLKDDDVFRKAASRQVAFYIWTGALVIVLILAVGGFAAQVVSRQVRLNRLKNDFIATVSHELKTPLASMRVLVDTLLAGHYRGQQQATEYLEMVSHENERLSRLIDNFLTFSRMERNRQTFDILRVSPATIARKAAEAVRTKFEQNQCKCDMKIDENLPDILADEDAMVTAVVNLLDNACKYSHDDKDIGMRVFVEDRLVCFSVTDNGIGLSRRAAKRVFKRFYQADRSLSRHAGGCGLGLSIVKFVVDAHKGSISVESKPGRGSTFTIKLAALK
ncbi:MAG: sensor histidine kinase [Planctomycetota bacterium]